MGKFKDLITDLVGHFPQSTQPIPQDEYEDWMLLDLLGPNETIVNHLHLIQLLETVETLHFHAKYLKTDLDIVSTLDQLRTDISFIISTARSKPS